MMTAALVRKELGELRPWAILSLFLGLSELATQLLEQVDMLPTEATIEMLSAESGRLYWLIALAIGTSLGVREAEDGTLAFLDGLPVGRTRVFLVKCAVTCALLAIGPLISLGSVAMLHELSHGSLDAALRADIVLGRFGLQLLVIMSGVLLGTAFGWLRSLTWLCLGVLVTALSIAIDRVPRVAIVSPFGLLDAPITSAPFRVDAEALLVQLALAALAGFTGWVAFLRAGKSASALDLRARPVVSAIVTVVTVIVSGVAISLNASDAVDEAEQEELSSDALAEVEPRFDDGPPAQTATAHYRFSYPAQNANAALALAARADAIYERTHALLATPASGSIDVDGSGSLENTDGTAYLGRVRISLVASEPEVVLAHETAHVIARRLAGDDRAWLWRKASVLDEGLATWVERHFQAGQGDRSGGRLVLAALHSRSELIFEELADPARLAAVRDDNLKYPAGEAVIAAIIRLHGAQALPRLIRAFATPTLPMDLEGLPLWQATFQLAGIDLGKVIDELFREVARDAEERKAEIAALPRIRVRIVKNEHGAFGIQPFVEPEGARVPGLQLRFKPEPGATLDTYETWPAIEGEPAFRADADIMNAQICVQAGLSIPPDQLLYEPWICLATADAELVEP